MIKVGIVGGAGYTAGELIRLLINHPEVEIGFIASESNAGKPLTAVHTGLYGDTDRLFDAEPRLNEVDVVFLCMGHGKSSEFLTNNPIPEGVKIIDLSQDFRDESEDFVYGLPEINRRRIKQARRLANPGCFATAIQLALLPAFSGGEPNHSLPAAITGDAQVVALTGSTGAGVKPSATTHFSYRSDNLSTYKEFTHQHLLEINRNLRGAFGDGETELPGKVNFVPMRGDFTRGIFVTAHFPTDLSEGQAVKLYKDFYADACFTHYVDAPLDLKQVVNTNKALVHVEKHGELLHVTAVIDNLLKGASGQALQNMNLMFGLPEHLGLRLKASAF